MDENVLPVGYAGRVKLLQHYINYYQSSGSGLAGALHDWQKRNAYQGSTARSVQEFLLPLLKYNQRGGAELDVCPATCLSRAVLAQLLSHFTQCAADVERYIEGADVASHKITKLHAHVTAMCNTLLHICDVAEVHGVLCVLIKLQTQLVLRYQSPAEDLAVTVSPRGNEPAGPYLGYPPLASPSPQLSPATPSTPPPFLDQCGCMCAPTRTFIAWSLVTHHRDGTAVTLPEVEAGEVVEPVRMPMAAEMKRKAVTTLTSWMAACKHSRGGGVVDHGLSVRLSGVTQWNSMFVQNFVDSSNDEFLQAIGYANRVDRLFCATVKQTLAVINGKEISELFARATQVCVASSMLTKSCILLLHKVMAGGLSQTSLRMIGASLSTIYCGSLQRPKEFTCMFGSVSPTPIPMDTKVSQKAIKMALRALYPLSNIAQPASQATAVPGSDATTTALGPSWYFLDENRSISKLRVHWHELCCSDNETKKCAEPTFLHNLLSFTHKASASEKTFTPFLISKVLNIGLVMELKAEGYLGFTIASLDLLLILQSPQFLGIVIRSYILEPHAQLERLILLCLIAPLISRLVPDQSSTIIMSCLHSLALMLESGSKITKQIREMSGPPAPPGYTKSIITVPLHRFLSLMELGDSSVDFVGNILGSSASRFPSGNTTPRSQPVLSPTLQITPAATHSAGVGSASGTLSRLLGPKDALKLKPQVMTIFRWVDESSLRILRECALSLQQATEEESFIHLRAIRTHMDTIYSKWQAQQRSGGAQSGNLCQEALSYSLNTQLHRALLVTLHSMNRFPRYVSSEVASMKVLGDGSSSDVVRLLACVSDEHTRQQLACRWLHTITDAQGGGRVLGSANLNYSQAATCFRLVRDTLQGLKTQPRRHLNVIQSDEIETTHKIRSWLHLLFAGHGSLEHLDDPDLLVYTKDVHVPAA